MIATRLTIVITVLFQDRGNLIINLRETAVSALSQMKILRALANLLIVLLGRHEVREALR